MFCISFNHKGMTTQNREQYALDEKEKAMLLEAVQQEKTMAGMVFLMTCNRSEVYFDGSREGYVFLENFFVRVKKIPSEKYRKSAMRYEGREAILHLFQVVCGLDSAVLGEVEIIRQVKQSYLEAKSLNCCTASLHIIFQNALKVAKEMAEQFRMTHLPISVGTLTQIAALEFCKDKEEPHILVIGARGDMGTVIRKNLLDAHKTLKIIGTIRQHRENYKDMGITFCDTERMQWVNYENRYEYLLWADVIISVTHSPHYTLLSEDTSQYLADNTGEKLFLDLAVPRDIDEAIGELPFCQLKNMDYIKELAKENNAQKISEAKRVRLLLDEKVEEIEKILVFQTFVKNNPDIMEQLSEKKASSLLFQLKKTLDYDAFCQVLDVFENRK